MPSTTSIRRVAAIGATAAPGTPSWPAARRPRGRPPSRRGLRVRLRSGSTQMFPPVIINVRDEATAKVGDFIDILVADNDIAGTTVDTDQPELVELTQAYEEEGGAIFNPGGKALAPGVAIITVTNPDSTTRDITLTITE